MSPEVAPCAACVTCASATSVVVTSASTKDRNHSSSRNIFVVGSFFHVSDINCVMNRKQYSSWKLPAAHFNVRTPRTLKIRVAAKNDCCDQVLLSFSRGSCRPQRRQFDVEKRRRPCVTSALHSLHLCGSCTSSRSSWYLSCGPSGTGDTVAKVFFDSVRKKKTQRK